MTISRRGLLAALPFANTLASAAKTPTQQSAPTTANPPDSGISVKYVGARKNENSFYYEVNLSGQGRIAMLPEAYLSRVFPQLPEHGFGKSVALVKTGLQTVFARAYKNANPAELTEQKIYQRNHRAYGELGLYGEKPAYGTRRLG